MACQLALNKMSIEEKIATMEAIWDDLSRNSQNLPPPKWHQKTLEQREADLQQGKETIYDWQTAKLEIKNALP